MVMDEEIESQNHTERGGFFYFVWELIKVSAVALAIILPIRYYVAQPFFVKGASMEPTLEDGDYLIINEISYRFSEPQRGDVVIFRFPNDPRQFFIKRIIALPGETIEIRNNRVVIFNKENPRGLFLDESAYLERSEITEGNLRVNLAKNEYFVLGDNRLQSSDSRTWGPLDTNLIIGKTFIRAWPPDKAEFFTPVSYPETM